MPGRDRRQRRRRVAALGGAAFAAKKHYDTKQAQQAEYGAPAEAQQAAPAEPDESAGPGGGLSPEALDELKQLGDLHERNVLTDDEFEREKAKLLDSA